MNAIIVSHDVSLFKKITTCMKRNHVIVWLSAPDLETAAKMADADLLDAMIIDTREKNLHKLSRFKSKVKLIGFGDKDPQGRFDACSSNPIKIIAHLKSN